MNSFGDEMESGATRHGDWGADVVSQDKDIGVIGRIFAPPTFPLLVGPGARIGPNMLRPRMYAPTFSKLRAAKSSSTPVLPPFAAVHLFEGAGGEEPSEDFFSAEAEGRFKGLVGAGAETVEGEREGSDFGFRHLGGWTVVGRFGFSVLYGRCGLGREGLRYAIEEMTELRLLAVNPAGL